MLMTAAGNEEAAQKLLTRNFSRLVCDLVIWAEGTRVMESAEGTVVFCRDGCSTAMMHTGNGTFICTYCDKVKSKFAEAAFSVRNILSA